MVRAECGAVGIERASFRFVRHDDRNRTIFRALSDEAAAFDQLARESAALGARLVQQGERAIVTREA